MVECFCAPREDAADDSTPSPEHASALTLARIQFEVFDRGWLLSTTSTDRAAYMVVDVLGGHSPPMDTAGSERHGTRWCTTPEVARSAWHEWAHSELYVAQDRAAGSRAGLGAIPPASHSRAMRMNKS